MHKLIVLIQFQYSFIQTRLKVKDIQTSIITLKDIENDGILKEQAICHQESTGHKYNTCKCQKIHSQWKKPGRKSTHNRIQSTQSPINYKLIFTDWNKSLLLWAFRMEESDSVSKEKAWKVLCLDCDNGFQNCDCENTLNWTTWMSSNYSAKIMHIITRDIWTEV